ncbi:MAG: D-sedoheptulose 7-phosphate isomerase [Candidatus Sulfotelmatobacter sp.]
MTPTSAERTTIFESAFADHIQVIQTLRDQRRVLDLIASEMVLAIRMGGKILWCGNGGSAADAQHLNGQLVVRFRQDRAGIPSIALSTDTCILTAASNNYGYEHIFERQVETLARKGDVVVAISTSGNSRNVFLALEAARKAGAVTVAFTGKGGGKVATAADFLFEVPSTDTPRIQEAHILAGHVLCEILEQELATGPGMAAPNGSGVKNPPPPRP